MYFTLGTNNNSMRIIKDVFWPEKMKLYFEQTMRATPSQFRNFASGNLVREIEDKARERNGTEVEEQDLVKAFLDTIPVYFRSDMVKLLADLGINVSRPKQEQIPVNDLVVVKDAIIKATGLAGVSHSEQIIESVMKAYEESMLNFHTCISFRTNTRRPEHRGLLVHIVDIFTQNNPYRVAIDNHLLPDNDMPIDKLFNELHDKIPVLGHTIEFGVETGIERIGIMSASHLPYRLSKILNLPSIPDSIRTNLPILERFHLKNVSIFSVDYLRTQVATRFMTIQIPNMNVEWIENILRSLEFKVPSSTIMELCVNAISIITGFSYIKSQLDYISFQVCVGSLEEMPKNMNSFIENYARNAPFRSENSKYVFSVVFMKNGQLLEIENDYSGTLVDSLTGPFNQKNMEEE